MKTFGFISFLFLVSLLPLACTNNYLLQPLASATATPTATSSAGGCDNGGNVTTLAGSGTYGSANGLGTAASFSNPVGVAVDSSNNIYIADSSNCVIRKLNTAGLVSTFAGSGTAGNANGIGTAAQFSYPWGVAVDAAGNVYVADSGNEQIKLITPAGVVSTLAGTGVPGSANGTASTAQFDGPTGLTVDSSGNVYVADFYSQMIRKITPGGVVSTLAGSGTAAFVNGTGTAASFYWPSDLAMDTSGNLYVTDVYNNAIRKVTPTGVVSTFAGTGVSGLVNGPGSAAEFDQPIGITIDPNGDLYIADRFNQVIRKITPGGVVSTLSGTGTAGFNNGPPTSATFNVPMGIAIDSNCVLFVSDDANRSIRELH